MTEDSLYQRYIDISPTYNLLTETISACYFYPFMPKDGVVYPFDSRWVKDPWTRFAVNEGTDALDFIYRQFDKLLILSIQKTINGPDVADVP